MPGKVRAQSPGVIAKAEKLGVDLAAVRPSGLQDTVTGDDVFRTAVAVQMGLPADASVAEILAGATVLAHSQRVRTERAETAAREAREAQQAAPSSTSSGLSSVLAKVAARGPAFALNPLVDRIRAEASSAAVAMPSTGEPSLFAAGDLPAFTASGIPPEALLGVPWQARHAMAAAPSAAEAYEIADDCAGGDDAEMWAENTYGGHPGNVSYAGRVKQWRTDNLSDAEVNAAIWGDDGPLEMSLPGYGATPR